MPELMSQTNMLESGLGLFSEGIQKIKGSVMGKVKGIQKGIRKISDS